MATEVIPRNSLATIIDWRRFERLRGSMEDTLKQFRSEGEHFLIRRHPVTRGDDRAYMLYHVDVVPHPLDTLTVPAEHGGYNTNYDYFSWRPFGSRLLYLYHIIRGNTNDIASAVLDVKPDGSTVGPALLSECTLDYVFRNEGEAQSKILRPRQVLGRLQQPRES